MRWIGSDYRERMDSLVVKLGGLCEVCGTHEDLAFDHIDPSTKIHNISSLVASGYTLASSVLLAEVEKCQLLCRSCHGRKTNVEDDKNHHRAKTHCPRGHEYDYDRPDGRGRECLSCRRETTRRWRERKKLCAG